VHRGRGQIQQRVQDNGRGPGLVGYAIWKLDTKSGVWVSLDAEIYSDSSPVSSYPSLITLYRSLHACQRLILESTIQEISYLGSPSIITGAGASCILSEKVLDVVGSSIDIWKTGWTEHIDLGRRRVNDRVPGWAVILESFFEGQVVQKNWALTKTLSPTLKSGAGERRASVDF